ncbi:molybdenum cofactor guanylyltransferase MobA [Halopseudomonas salegens]|uniref:Molybdenum cofactor guanylyltransferase n=1 Tax=Halopseudomonas salegens TaxID=1434072 RepID=A0A1H2FW40_9GAMM|nr:molybdenum cofactor guanylyltransferase MobA [Halopseudomonas salegens]SDU11547.1 molybdenum cofactor guanylyltransferase [Halopseudomonas salegens]
MAMHHSFQPDGLILAGGRGQRLGGRDKGLMIWRGQPVAAHLSSLLRPLVGELLISCNRNQAMYQAWADRLLADADTDFPGPLAGMLAGLDACRGSHLLVLPCDLPYLDTALLQDLLDLAAQRSQHPVLVRSGQQWQPLLAVLPRESLSALQAAWVTGERSPRRWLSRQQPVFLDLPGDDPRLFNANLPEHWK